VDIETTDEEELAVSRLEAALKDFPNTIWLFAASGSLYVMKNGPDGEHVVEADGCMDSDYIIGQLFVDCDGGDW